MPFQIVRSDITKMKVEAIVNTANPVPGYGPGIDAAVYEAAGAKRLLARRIKIGVIERGTSVITEGFKLSAKYIIHTVTTPWRGGCDGEEEVLKSSYRSIFELVKQNGIKSLALPLLASGSYGFPKGIALRIALSEIESFMKDHDLDLYLVVFDDKAFALSTELYGDIDEYISDKYVEEKKAEEYCTEQCFEDRCEASAFEERRPRGLDSLKLTGAAGNSLSAPKPRKEKKADRISNEAVFDAALQECVKAPMMLNRSLDDVISNLDKTFMELVFSFADAKGISDVELQKKSNIGRKAFSKLKCGTTKNPSKSTALALAVGLELSLDETRDLLSRAGFALSPCSRQDIIVQYFIEREAYDIYEINIALFEHGEALLGSQAS